MPAAARAAASSAFATLTRSASRQVTVAACARRTHARRRDRPRSSWPTHRRRPGRVGIGIVRKWWTSSTDRATNSGPRGKSAARVRQPVVLVLDHVVVGGLRPEVVPQPGRVVPAGLVRADHGRLPPEAAQPVGHLQVHLRRPESGGDRRRAAGAGFACVGDEAGRSAGGLFAADSLAHRRFRSATATRGSRVDHLRHSPRNRGSAARRW